MPLFASSTFFILLALLFFTLFIGAAATISLRQIFALSQGVKTQRSHYKKRAIQALELAFVLYSVLFFISAIDIGFTKIFFTSINNAVYNVIVFLPIFLSFSLFLVRYWFRDLKASQGNTISWFWALLSAFTSIKALGLIIIGTYVTLYISPESQNLVDPEILSTNQYIAFIQNAINNIYLPMFSKLTHCLYMLAFFLLSGIAMGYSLQLLYTLICRSNDDFGRDYYNASIKDYTKNAYFAMTLLCTLVLIGILGQVIPFAINNLAYVVAFYPLVLVLYFVIMRSQNPLRFKISIAICPLLLLIASVFFVVQTM